LVLRVTGNYCLIYGALGRLERHLVHVLNAWNEMIHMDYEALLSLSFKVDQTGIASTKAKGRRQEFASNRNPTTWTDLGSDS
jgi:hypothetical protein